MIPKEIRRTMRIREGDPLEIYTGAGGEVVFRKYSPIGELAEIAGAYAEAAAIATKLGFIITDRDHCVSAAGISKKDIIDREISDELATVLENRQGFVYEGGTTKIHIVPDLPYFALAVFPIIAAGDLCGSVILVPSATVSEAEEKDVSLARVAATFLGKQLED